MSEPSAPSRHVRRLFRDVSKDEFTDVATASMLVQMGWAGTFSWEDLLKSRRVLIIAEAGTGKTYECRRQQRSLWGNGEPAFALDLAELAANGVTGLLLDDESERLAAWQKAQSDVATFFLDSIDELKLTRQSLETALRHLRNVIGGHLGRVRIIITSRPVAFDRMMLERYLPIPAPRGAAPSANVFADAVLNHKDADQRQDSAASPPPWRSVALMPLSDAQIVEIAKNEGIREPDALLADIRSRDAEDFARRPQDLIELCMDWRDHRRIRSHREQIERNIYVKLRPRQEPQELAELSDEQALEGSSRLALAALLTRKLTIRHSAQSDRGGESGSALDPAAVLPDWRDDERRTLLERGLFEFASYGRVRFHHQSVIEYLAARRLNALHARGMPIKALKRLIFAETLEGEATVRPTMRPVAAWLSASQPSIFSEVCDREPGILLDYADPASLTRSMRANTLRAYVARYGTGGWRGQYVPKLQADRFASRELGTCVRELWSAGVQNQEVRELLIQLIGGGPIPELAEAVFGLAMDASAAEHERVLALEALIRLSDTRVEQITRSMADDPRLWPPSLLRGAIVRVFPEHISADRFCDILKRIPPEANHTVDLMEWQVPRTVDASDLSHDYLNHLRINVTDLVVDGLAWGTSWHHLVSKRPHLVPLLAAVCLRLINDGPLDSEIIRSAVIALRLRPQDRPHDESLQALHTAVESMPPQDREAVFWADDAFCEQLHAEPESSTRLFRDINQGPIALTDACDGDWMRGALAKKSRALPDRMMMLVGVMWHVRKPDDDWRDHVMRLKPLVADEPILTTTIDNAVAPRKPDPRMLELERQIQQTRTQHKAEEAKRRASWLAFWEEIANHPDDVFHPSRENNTAWNLWKAMRSSGIESRASGWNRRFIEMHFGKVIADRLRSSMMRIWRTDHPTLRSERPPAERNQFLIRWQFGLAAIYAEAEDPQWARKLSADEAALAARYVPIELNGFPGWFGTLIGAHPKAVDEVIGRELSVELSQLPVTGSFDDVLQNIRHASPAVARLFVPRLKVWLDARDDSERRAGDESAAISRLERVVSILLNDGDADTYEDVCSAAKRQVATDARPASRIWVTALMMLDPRAGIDAFEALLDHAGSEATELAVRYIGSMFGEGDGLLAVNLRDRKFTPDLLLRLTRIAYRYVRHEEDVEHEGVFSLGVRDHGEEGRGLILKALIEAEGPDAWSAKLKLADDPLAAHFRDRLIFLAHEKASEETDDSVLSEVDVVKLDQYGEAPPATRDEMFRLTVDRLDDLDDFLLQDTSPRSVWAGVSVERDMRRLVAQRLRDVANHVYTVDQESVTAEEKETDIRLRASASDQQTVIELKIGEKWSGRVLRETIKNQLVRKYMAPENCRSGILLVTVACDREWDHPDTGVRLDIHGLRKLLDETAGRACQETGYDVRIAAKVLDLRPRLPVEARA